MENKKKITDTLFICIIINLIPVFLLGVFNISNTLYTIATLIVYVIQTTIMIMAVKEKIFEINKNERTFLIVFAVLQIVTQGVNLIRFHSILIKDVANVASVIINIFLFIFMCLKFEIDKTTFLEFMKKMIKLGVVAYVVGILLNAKDMIINLFITKNSYAGAFKSFFANRNNFGMFLLIMSISNLYIILNDKKKKDIYIQILFTIGILLTMSRNCIIGMFLFYLLVFVFNYKKIRQKFTDKQIKSIILITLIVITLFIFIIVLFPKSIQTMDQLFIRSYTISPDSGRLKVWKNGLQIFLYNPILGVGRYRAINLNQSIFNSKLTHFHSIYMETLATYGVIGFVVLIYFIYSIFKKIKNSKIDSKDKKIILSGLITFLFVSCFETTCRMSIGYVDTMSMIYFIIIPIMYANKKKDKEEK